MQVLCLKWVSKNIVCMFIMTSYSHALHLNICTNKTFYGRPMDVLGGRTTKRIENAPDNCYTGFFYGRHLDAFRTSG